MLLLVTIVLVLIAAVMLIIGIFGSNLALIFVSIGASALAAIVLLVLSQMNRRTAREGVAAEGAPAAVPADRPATREPVVEEEPTLVGVPSGAPSSAAAALPIADYDSLRVNEIIPRLSDLDLDELEAVAQHEESTKNRTTILNRIDDLMDQLEAEEGVPAAVIADVDDQTIAAGATPTGFPIDGYDQLDEDAAIAALAGLDADQLEEVAEYEETHANRDAVLDAIDDRLDVLEGVAPAAAKKATAKKASAKKAGAKKSGTKRAAPTKSAVQKAATRPTGTAAKKAVAKKSASSGGARKAAPAAAKKATAKKAAAKKASAKKASAKKAAKRAR